MTTRERIEADYIKEFKAKNTSAMEALRMLRSAIKQIEVDSRKTLEEADVIDIVGKEMKKLKDALDQFTTGGRADLVEKTKGEMAVLTAYLPQQLSDDELKAVIARIIGGMGEVTAKDFGKIMGAVTAETKGKADGGKVMGAVKEALAGK
ncbi:MAG: hypothetical protein RLZZ324_197 [Candidatus Parcubacteria bacterium]|jgi:uncharacterized protein YqeY